MKGLLIGLIVLIGWLNGEFLLVQTGMIREISNHVLAANKRYAEFSGMQFFENILICDDAPNIHPELDSISHIKLLLWREGLSRISFPIIVLSSIWMENEPTWMRGRQSRKLEIIRKRIWETTDREVSVTS